MLNYSHKFIHITSLSPSRCRQVFVSYQHTIELLNNINNKSFANSLNESMQENVLSNLIDVP